jgi:c(7)-type cytochrome triheme protein
MVDEVYLQTETVGKVVFSHSVHGTGCGECHPKLFEKKRSNLRVSMKAMEEGKSCGGCHNGKKAFSVTANCTSCHAGNILYKEKDAGDVIFPHSAHTGMYGCDSCHPGLFKAERGANRATMEEMEQGKSCGACHDGSTAFSVAEACDSCHKM